MRAPTKMGKKRTGRRVREEDIAGHCTRFKADEATESERIRARWPLILALMKIIRGRKSLSGRLRSIRYGLLVGKFPHL